MIEPNSTRAEDWTRFGNALLDLLVKPLAALIGAVLDVLHTGKNILVEEARRWGFELRPSKR
jgi:hypothetical protein